MCEGNFAFEDQMCSRVLDLSTEAPGREVPSENINNFSPGYMSRDVGNLWHPMQSLSNNLILLPVSNFAPKPIRDRARAPQSNAFGL